MASYNAEDITEDTIELLKRMLYYAELAEARGDQAHMESSNYEKKVVITVKLPKKEKKVDGPGLQDTES